MVVNEWRKLIHERRYTYFSVSFLTQSNSNKLAVLLLKDRRGNLMDPGGREKQKPEV